MSVQEQTNISHSSEFSLNTDSFFKDLEQEFQSLWNTEVTQYTQKIQPSFESTAVSAPARKPRRQPKRPLVRAPLAAKPASSPAYASRRRVARKQRLIFKGSWLKAAGIAATVVGLSLGSYELVNNYRLSQEPAPLRQVMYQNAQTKVAAFRKEIQEGEYFLEDEDHPIEYIAQPGDTVEKISHKFHVSPNTIIKNNVRSKINDIIEPGTKLYILPVDGIAHPVEKHETLAELSKRYKVGVQDIIDANQLDNPHMITEKQKVIIPNATELKRRPKPKVKPLVQSLKALGNHGQTPLIKAQTGRRLSWPTAGIVTSGFGWRWFRMHSGMDIAGPVGTAVKAAKEGRVVYSGWMGGYGYCIDIDHGNGVVTRYGHNSALQAQVGQYVYRGQTIASMGSTGHSTGPHLHFEVHVNGSAVDPRGYF